MGKITLHRVPLHSPEWYNFRRSGVGGSEAGTVLGSQFNQYGSRIKIFYQKIGAVAQDTEPSEVCRHGSLLEEYIVEKWWRYFNGNIEDTIKNQLSDNVVRKCQMVNGYYTNSDYPWLFCSLDRKINKGQMMLNEDGTGLLDINPGTGILECKTINSFVSRKYDGGIPPYQIIQCQMYMGVLGIDYCEIAILEDGRKFYCLPIRFSEPTFNYILEKTFDFWQNHVVPAKSLYEELLDARSRGDVYATQRIETQIQGYEPEVDGNDETREFVSAKFKELQDRETMQGDESMKAKAIRYKYLNRMIKNLVDKKDTIYNDLMNTMANNQALIIELPGGGHVKAFKKEGSRNHQLSFSVKTDIESVADETSEKI